MEECCFDTEIPDTVLSCVMPYIHPTDLNSVSLVSRKLYKLDVMTRKHLTIKNCYALPLSRLVKRFPYLHSLTLEGYPRNLMCDLESIKWGGYVTLWLEEIVESLKWLECVRFKRLNICDKDLEVLAERYGEKLKVLRIERCAGFTTYGLLHIGKRCSGLRILSLERSSVDDLGGEWLHELALRNKCLESLNCLTPLDECDYEDFVLIAKNCSKSLVSLKLRRCPRKYVADAFRFAVMLEEFGGDPYIGEGEEYTDVKFPPKMQRITWSRGHISDIHIMRNFGHQLTKLDLRCSRFGSDAHRFLIRKCVNLEELYMNDVIGDIGLKTVGRFCKKLRRIKIRRSGLKGMVSDIGLTDLAKGCLELECLHVHVKDITNETLGCIGANLKKLKDFYLGLFHKGGEEVRELPLDDGLPLDNGVRVLLTGCTKLAKLGIILWSGKRELSDVGWGYVGKYGQNLVDLNLVNCRDTDAGLLELSKGCPKLQKLEMFYCEFSQQALADFLLKVTSLRYLRVHAFKSGNDIFAAVGPFWKMELIKYKSYFDSLLKSPRRPPSLLAYYSVAEQRKDILDNVIPTCAI